MTRMTEEEALIRAREAAIQTVNSYRNSPSLSTSLRRGELDDDTFVQTAKRALLDLDKPLPVERDLEDLRVIVGAWERWQERPMSAGQYERGEYDDDLRGGLLPTFRAIIQRRIEEVGMTRSLNRISIALCIGLSAFMGWQFLLRSAL